MADAPDRDASRPWKTAIGDPLGREPAGPAEPPVATPKPVAPPEDEVIGLGQAGRIFVAIFGTWMALFSIPNALPWNAIDDADRAIGFGVLITSLVAIVSVPVSLRSTGSRSISSMWVGLSAALIGLGLGGLQVVRSLLVPVGISKSVVLGAGLIALLIFAFLLTWRRQVVGIATSMRISTVSVVGSLAAVALIAAYLVVTNSLLGFVRVPADEWARYTDLRNGLQALAFGAAGALLASSIQKGGADRAMNRADDNAQAAAANFLTAQRALDLAEAGAGVFRVDDDGAPVLDDVRVAELADLRGQLKLPR